jgi:23S rRNA pseudouridine2605 synthase/23S rRNA pseudouridine2604 synthase
MAGGMPMMGTRTRPARVRRATRRRFRITLKEGKNRQIRRMVRKVGHHVVTLKRIRMASIRLGNLKEGRWRHLTAREVAGLLEALPPDIKEAGLKITDRREGA